MERQTRQPAIGAGLVACAEPDGGDAEFPTSAELCRKCSVKASIMMDGCMTCLNCGDSKCS